MQRIGGNIYTLAGLLPVAERGGFAVGAFSPRYTPMIRAILLAAESTRSPVIVQVAQVELNWYQLTLTEFARQFWKQFDEVRLTVPVGLHLDHTSDFGIIKSAVELGFTSVMIDASALPFEQNMAETSQVVSFAHACGVSVEAELGRIGSADGIESGYDEELYTDPQEAADFARQTGVDALAVSVGTAHGVYQVRQPKIDFQRLSLIRSLTPVHLVLHGGSGVPAEMVLDAIRLPGGGVSKVNIATDLELALLKVLGREERMTDSLSQALPASDLKRGVSAVQQVVEDKITHFLLSLQHASDYSKDLADG